MTTKRLDFLARAAGLEGSPYLWAAKGRRVGWVGGREVLAFDCSGLVTHCLLEVGGPDLRAFHNCQRLWDELPPVETPLPGDLAFYSRTPDGRISHVMVTWGDGRVFGACGGDESTTTLQAASSRGARVRFRKSHLYRTVFRGFRSLSQYLDKE